MGGPSLSEQSGPPFDTGFLEIERHATLVGMRVKLRSQASSLLGSELRGNLLHGGDELLRATVCDNARLSRRHHAVDREGLALEGLEDLSIASLRAGIQVSHGVDVLRHHGLQSLFLVYRELQIVADAIDLTQRPLGVGLLFV